MTCKEVDINRKKDDSCKATGIVSVVEIDSVLSLVP